MKSLLREIIDAREDTPSPWFMLVSNDSLFLREVEEGLPIAFAYTALGSVLTVDSDLLIKRATGEWTHPLDDSEFSSNLVIFKNINAREGKRLAAFQSSLTKCFETWAANPYCTVLFTAGLSEWTGVKDIVTTIRVSYGDRIANTIVGKTLIKLAMISDLEPKISKLHEGY